MKTVLASAVLCLLAACATSHSAAAPVKVLVTVAQNADRGDAARLQELTKQAIRHRGVSAPRVVTIEYYGSATAAGIAPSVFEPYQLVFAAFTITDPTGKVLHREWLRDTRSSERLKLLHDAAEVIAARVSGS